MLGELVELGRERLAQAQFSPSPREAGLLLGHVLGLSETQVLARHEDTVAEDATSTYLALLERRLRGEPVAYLVGRREFYGREFRVDRRVLIPRPETEHLIEAALSLALPHRPRVLDLGTGSGSIAATLALEMTGATVVAVDSSLGALDVARSNLDDLLAAPATDSEVRLVAGDLATALALDRFHLVVSNPPYVDPMERSGLSPEVVDFEPHAALFAPHDSDSIIRRLIDELDQLASGTFLVFEIGHLQGGRINALLDGSTFELVRTLEDYQGIARVVVARRT